MSSFIIKNGRVIDPATALDAPRDVLVQGGIIARIAPPGTLEPVEDAAELDARGLCVLPGLIDMHVHLREPGEEYKEDIESGSRAAAAGGFSTIVAMANTRPVADNSEVVAYVERRGAEVGLVRVLPVGAVTVGQKGEVLAPFGELVHAGAVALSDDGHFIKNAKLMRHALEYAQDFSIPILSHAEDPDLSEHGHMHEGAVSTRLGLRGILGVAEDIAVIRDVMLAEHTGGRLHVCHVSTRGAVEIIRAAKHRGVNVTAEATPHHFTLLDEAVADYDTCAKMRPPLRGEADREAVIEGLMDGTLEVIATDHAPHSVIEKDTTFGEAANGIIGLQTALPLALALWRAQRLTLMQVIERLTLGPARALGIDAGALREGGRADLALVDLDEAWCFDLAEVLSKSNNSPFLGQQMRGRVVTTMVAGRITHTRSGGV